MRLSIRVRPGAARPGVGGEHDGALVVRVRQRAVGGQATEAALAALAAALGVRRRDVALVTGTTSRTKLVEVTGAEEASWSRSWTACALCHRPAFTRVKPRARRDSPFPT